EEEAAERREAVLQTDDLVFGGVDVLARGGKVVLLLVTLFREGHAARLFERAPRVARVHPLVADSYLTFERHITPYKLKLSAFDSFAATVTCCSFGPYFSCHATTVYVPGRSSGTVSRP